jgi:exodeoxyribonuclease V alpha subunit
MEEITAKISGVVFSNKQTGFCVLRTALDSGREVFVQGSFPGTPVQVGLKAKFVGHYVDDAKYGRRLHATNCELLPEKGRVGVVQYLTANVPSIGQVTALKLYAAFGDELVDILNTDPERVRTLEFLQARQADAIIKEWSQASENRTTAIFLTDLGLSSYQVRNVVAKMGVGQKVREKIQENPYCLYDCPGVGFPTADSASRKLGVSVDDSRRVCAMILFVMNELADSDGHVYCTSKQILDFVNQKLFKRHMVSPFTHGDFMSDSHFYAALMELRDKGQVYTDDNRNYLSSNWKFENDSAEYLSQMVSQAPKPLGDLREALEDFETDKQLQLSDEQKEAFFMLDRGRVCVVSGAPGTGKTLLTSAFVHLFETNDLHYELLSPTGIAAKRLSQMTGKPASTIHRALGYGHDGEWEHNRHNKYFCDAVIVDEMSMVDSNTFYHLVSALPSTTLLVLVGDSDQLPSVGAGDVLRSLMTSDDVPHVRLTHIYRQEEASDIIKVAHKMLGSKQIDTTFNAKSDFVFLKYPQEQVLDEIRDMAQTLKRRSEMSPIPFTFQVIAPTYKGDLGVDNLNLELREVLNPDYAARRAAFVKHGDVNFFEGDRVMVVRNDYERAIFNGDVGKIMRISVKHDEFEVKIFNWFDQEAAVPTYTDKVFTFKIEEAKGVLKVAYACTAHKVQGQEFDYVLMPMTKQYGIMLYRNLVYTAITRAKRKVFLFGDPEAFRLAVYNERDSKRNSHLAELVHEHLEQTHSSPRLSGVFREVANA